MIRGAIATRRVGRIELLLACQQGRQGIGVVFVLFLGWRRPRHLFARRRDIDALFIQLTANRRVFGPRYLGLIIDGRDYLHPTGDLLLDMMTASGPRVSLTSASAVRMSLAKPLNLHPSSPLTALSHRTDDADLFVVRHFLMGQHA